METNKDVISLASKVFTHKVIPLCRTLLCIFPESVKFHTPLHDTFAPCVTLHYTLMPGPLLSFCASSLVCLILVLLQSFRLSSWHPVSLASFLTFLSPSRHLPTWVWVLRNPYFMWCYIKVAGKRGREGERGWEYLIILLGGWEVLEQYVHNRWMWADKWREVPI